MTSSPRPPCSVSAPTVPYNVSLESTPVIVTVTVITAPPVIV